MNKSKITNVLKLAKFLIIPVRSYRVTVVGGASKLGQTVSFLLRSEPGITCLNVYDASPRIYEVSADLKHIPAENANLVAITDEDELFKRLQETDIVLVTDGIPETLRHFQTQDEFSANASLIHMMAFYISKLKPMPFVGIATEPINVMVPVAAEIMQRHGTIAPRKLIGITGEDALRAQVMYGELHSLNPLKCSVPVVCGHSSDTAVPLLSQATPHRPINAKTAQHFTERFREISHETNCQDHSGSRITLAYSVLQFTRAIMQAFEAKSKPIIHAYVENNDFGTDFFEGRMRLTPDGAGDMERYANLSEYECNLLQNSIQKLRSEVWEAKKLLKTEELS